MYKGYAKSNKDQFNEDGQSKPYEPYARYYNNESANFFGIKT